MHATHTRTRAPSQGEHSSNTLPELGCILVSYDIKLVLEYLINHLLLEDNMLQMSTPSSH